VEARFGELEYEAGWVESYQRRLAFTMVSALGDYTRDRRREGASVVATEAFFSIHHGNVVVRGVIDRLEATASGDILVVDLKTGAHQTDAGVADNPQMLAYQMGLESSEITTLWDHGNAGSAGAVLLFVKQGVRGKTYRLAAQAPLTSEGRNAFLERIEKAAAVISSHEFSGEPRAFGPPGSPARHRWHAIGQVCGDV
jgi:RecB family exonuclease